MTKIILKNTSSYDYELPEELIAQYPAKERSTSRMLVLNRKHQTVQHKHFIEIADYFDEGDVLVLNNTKVIPARL